MSEVWSKWQGRFINGAFPLHRYLGSSDHSGVYLTELPGHHPTEVAIKLVRAITPFVDLHRTQWEAAAGLAHPGLMRLLETGPCQLDGQPYLYVVMEHADQTLAQLLEKRALSHEEAREMLLPVLDVLAFLHNRNLVQGQLKPTNILVVGDQLKLASDTVRGVSEATANINMVSVYDPPEIHDGVASTASDMWALGVTLLEALTRSAPMGLDVRRERVVLPADFSPVFRDVVAGCLSRRPFDRPKAAELAARLRGVEVPPAVVPVTVKPKTAGGAPAAPVKMAAPAAASAAVAVATRPVTAAGVAGVVAKPATVARAPVAVPAAPVPTPVAPAPASVAPAAAMPATTVPAAVAPAARVSIPVPVTHPRPSGTVTHQSPIGRSMHMSALTTTGSHPVLVAPPAVVAEPVKVKGGTPPVIPPQRPAPKPIVIEHFTPEESVTPDLAPAPVKAAPVAEVAKAGADVGEDPEPSKLRALLTLVAGTAAILGVAYAGVHLMAPRQRSVVSQVTAAVGEEQVSELEPRSQRSEPGVLDGVAADTAEAARPIAVSTVGAATGQAAGTVAKPVGGAMLVKAGPPFVVPPKTVATAVAKPAAAASVAPVASTPEVVPVPPPADLHEEIPQVPARTLQTIRGHVRVTVRLIVDKDGNVFAALVDQHGPSRYFERVAIEAAKKWTFPPLDTAESRLELVRFDFTRQGATGRAVEIE